MDLCSRHNLYLWQNETHNILRDFDVFVTHACVGSCSNNNKWPVSTYVSACKQAPLEICFIYLGNSEI